MWRFPTCRKCGTALLVPLSDYGEGGAAVLFKAWACTDEKCGFVLRIDKGLVGHGQKGPDPRPREATRGTRW